MSNLFLRIAVVAGLMCIGVRRGTAEVGKQLARTGDEIVVCGQLFHTMTPVVTWMDPGGYDAYRVERRFGPYEESSWRDAKEDLASPNRFNLRAETLTAEQRERLRGGGWSLEELREVVDQFVIHYDMCGTSKTCFRVLHDERCLSVHFLLDVDGTIYQTLDLKERAWHATTSNGRSIGIEIAQVGAVSNRSRAKLVEWYAEEEGPGDGLGPRMTIPARFGKEMGIRTPGFVGRPARPQLIVGEVQQIELYQYDFTPQQYDALVKLTATLCRVFPKLACQYPADEAGQVIARKLPDAQLRDYRGLLGHFHIQVDKVDPGPAFDWRRVVGGARRILEEAAAAP